LVLRALHAVCRDHCIPQRGTLDGLIADGDGSADGSFRLWHHVTPADGGYGREVDIMLPADYFKKNSARDFYEQIAPLQMIPVSNYSKEADIKALASALKAANLR
jgi:hypothetical protein